jgi:hypothetical protein
MEVLNASASALAVASLTISFITQLSTVSGGVRASSFQSPKKILSELPVLLSLLEEISDSALHSRSAPSGSVTVAMEICVDRFRELMDCLQKMGVDPQTGLPVPGKRRRLRRQLVEVVLTYTHELEEATKRFRSALTLLRDIAME